MTKIPALFELMLQRNITQKQLADGIGVSTGNISDWKSGRSSPNIEVLPKIADYLNCSVDYLLGRTDNPQAHEGISAEISEDKQNLLEMFDQLHEDDKIRIITKMETIIEDYSEKAEKAASRSTIFRAAKSADNHPSEIITTDKDFSKIPPTEIEL